MPLDGVEYCVTQKMTIIDLFFQDIVLGTFTNGFQCCYLIVETGQYNYWNIGCTIADMSEGINPLAVRQRKVR